MNETNFEKTAKEYAKNLSYTEYEAEEMTVNKVKLAGKVIDNQLEEPRLDELCSILELPTDELDNPAVKFTPIDLALAGWSNWGAGSWERAHPESSLDGGEFIVLNDYFHDIVSLAKE